MDESNRVFVGHEADIVTARTKGRELARVAGFSGTDLTIIATAISEVARNIITYAERGEIELSVVESAGRSGVQIVARDEGPGIANTELVMQDGYSTGNSLGLGLPGARRLMDHFEIVSEVGSGTTITMTKWVP